MTSFRSYNYKFQKQNKNGIVFDGRGNNICLSLTNHLSKKWLPQNFEPPNDILVAFDV